MKIKSILLLMLLCFLNYSFSPDCIPRDRQNMVMDGLKNYDIVFYGEAIKFNKITGDYTFKIIELFKGKINSGIVKGKWLYKDENSIYPTGKDLWIVYANFNRDKTISMSLCSPSMGLDNFKGSSPPPPPPANFADMDRYVSALDSQVERLQYDRENLLDWINQLERLRIYKASQNFISQNEKSDLELANYAKYILISLITAIFLLIVLIIVVLKKKKMAHS